MKPSYPELQQVGIEMGQVIRSCGKGKARGISPIGLPR
jgi:hypothetical protein